MQLILNSETFLHFRNVQGCVIFFGEGVFTIFEILKRRDFGKYFCQNNSENTRGKNDEVKICISTTKKYEGGLKNPYTLQM